MFRNSAGKFGAPLKTKNPKVFWEAHQKNESFLEWSREKSASFPGAHQKNPEVFLDGHGKNPRVLPAPTRKNPTALLDGWEKLRQVFSGQIQEHVGKYFREALKNATSLLWIGPQRVGKYFRHILNRPQASSLITVSIFVVTNVSWCRRIIIKGLLLYCLSIRKFGKSRMRIKHVTNSNDHKPDDSSLFRQYMSNYQWRMARNMELVALEVAGRASVCVFDRTGKHCPAHAHPARNHC